MDGVIFVFYSGVVTIPVIAYIFCVPFAITRGIYRMLMVIMLCSISYACYFLYYGHC